MVKLISAPANLGGRRRQVHHRSCVVVFPVLASQIFVQPAWPDADRLGSAAGGYLSHGRHRQRCGRRPGIHVPASRLEPQSRAKNGNADLRSHGDADRVCRECAQPLGCGRAFGPCHRLSSRMVREFVYARFGFVPTSSHRIGGRHGRIWWRDRRNVDLDIHRISFAVHWQLRPSVHPGRFRLFDRPPDRASADAPPRSRQAHMRRTV